MSFAVKDDVKIDREPATKTRSRRVLVIDDEPVLRTTFKYLLEDLGYRVWVAANGREGIECFTRVLPDLVITDMLMPELDGFETIRQIRTVCPALPIIAMSAVFDELRMERELTAGITCCVQKPIDERVLVDLLHAMFEPEPNGPV